MKRKKRIPDWDKPYTKADIKRISNALKKLAKINESPELQEHQKNLLKELKGK